MTVIKSSSKKTSKNKTSTRKKTTPQKRVSTKTTAKKSTKTERRQQILEASRDIFAKLGYARATVDDIAHQAGVARGTFYLYFDDKRDAFEELIGEFGQKISHSIMTIVTDEDARPVGEQVLDNIRAILGVCLAERAMTKILFTDAVGVDHEFERKLTAFYDTLVQLLTETLRDGQALGVVSDGEPRVMAYMTMGALKELLYQAVTLGLAEESAEALTNQIFEFLSNGYLRFEKQPGGKKRRRD
ncbi:MAG: TetR/AcrR family transcriptional regulator [Polyangiaceae bacterium]|nr:TetR/AcrR family transcriptional regulator [Polyangiaceae bacterium]